MNRTLRQSALLPIGVLVIAAASGLLLRSKAGSESPPVISREDDRAPTVADTRKPGAAAMAGETSTSAASLKPGESSRTVADQRQLLETVGALTAAHSAQAYFNIGLIADARAKGTYTGKDSTKVLDTILALLDSVDRKLAGLSKLDLDKEDRESLEQILVLSALLRQQGRGLQEFWDSGKDEDAAKYENVRKDSWAAIGKLTGMGR
jgi:hypothetical protein